MFEQKVVSDIMDGSIVPLSVDSRLGEAVESLVASKYSGLPVVDSSKKLCGFLSEHDCLRYLISSSYYLDDRTIVSDIMFREPMSVMPSERVLHLAERMEGGKPKIYPVCDQGHLMGVVTRKDVMRELAAALSSTKVSA